MEKEYHVAVRVAEEGGFWGEVLELPGCYGSGETLAELKSDIVDSIEAYLTVAAELAEEERETEDAFQEVLRVLGPAFSPAGAVAVV